MIFSSQVIGLFQPFGEPRIVRQASLRIRLALFHCAVHQKHRTDALSFCSRPFSKIQAISTGPALGFVCFGCDAASSAAIARSVQAAHQQSSVSRHRIIFKSPSKDNAATISHVAALSTPKFKMRRTFYSPTSAASSPEVMAFFAASTLAASSRFASRSIRASLCSPAFPKRPCLSIEESQKMASSSWPAEPM